MAKKSYDESKVVRLLNKNANVNVNTVLRIVEVVTENDTVGNGTWGKIDFLTNYCDYVVSRVKFIGKKHNNNKKEDTIANVDTKVKKVITLSDKPKVKKVKRIG